jgi:hypothetical protein
MKKVSKETKSVEGEGSGRGLTRSADECGRMPEKWGPLLEMSRSSLLPR